MATLAPILCKACQKDITNSKRIRSPQGHFYCEACCAAAAARKASQQSAAPAKASLIPAPARRGPVAPAPADQPPARRAGRSPAPAAGPREPLTRCPNCDAPIIPGRKICIKCRRDTTQMDDIIARRAERGRGSAEEHVGTLISSAIRWVGILLIVCIIGGAAYMGYFFLHPGTVFDNYPTTREAAVRQFLACVAEGSDQGYEKAFDLVSLRLHQSPNPNEPLRYKTMYARMHDEFTSKYGPDWPSKAKIEREDPDSSSAQEITYRVTLNEDTYHVVTEGQLLITNAAQLMDNHETFPEDGKHHFGIADVEEYSLLPKAKDRVDIKKLMEQMRQMQGQHAN